MKLAHRPKVPCTEFSEVPGIAGITAGERRGVGRGTLAPLRLY
jgi:hypothetical protein